MWLSVQQVTLGYPGGPPVLEGVDLDLGPGLWAMVGANGSGKSSLLRCAAGILQPRQGRLAYNGGDAWQRPAQYRYHLGYAPQEVEEFPDLAASQYLSYLAALKGIRPALQAARVREVLAMMRLEDGLPARYSAGMRRRLAIAAALLNDPDLLLLDEPTVGLDPQEIRRLRDLLGRLAADRIILLATHVPEEWDGVADHWVVVENKGAYIHGHPDSRPYQDLSGRGHRP